MVDFIFQGQCKQERGLLCTGKAELGLRRNQGRLCTRHQDGGLPVGQVLEQDGDFEGSHRNPCSGS